MVGWHSARNYGEFSHEHSATMMKKSAFFPVEFISMRFYKDAAINVGYIKSVGVLVCLSALFLLPLNSFNQFCSIFFCSASQ